MNEIRCPHCGRVEGQLKIGRNKSGSQRYICKVCRRKYTPDPKPLGYDAALREQAVRMYVDGVNFRRIGRLLGVTHQSVANWVAAHARTVPDVPPCPPSTARTPLAVSELDELYTFDGEKKSGSTSSPA